MGCVCSTISKIIFIVFQTLKSMHVIQEEITRINFFQTPVRDADKTAAGKSVDCQLVLPKLQSIRLCKCYKHD